jgi:hypothetical protein
MNLKKTILAVLVGSTALAALPAFAGHDDDDDWHEHRRFHRQPRYYQPYSYYVVEQQPVVVYERPVVIYRQPRSFTPRRRPLRLTPTTDLPGSAPSAAPSPARSSAAASAKAMGARPPWLSAASRAPSWGTASPGSALLSRSIVSGSGLRD